MLATITDTREELNEHAPRITKLTIDTEKIGALIGPGGKTIRSIVEESGATVDGDNDGKIDIRTSAIDALHSTARKLASMGWKRNQPSLLNGSEEGATIGTDGAEDTSTRRARPNRRPRSEDSNRPRSDSRKRPGRRRPEGSSRRQER